MKETAGMGLLLLGCLTVCSRIRLSTAFAVIGYMPEYRLGGNYNYEEAFAAGLTHVIFFSLEVSPVDYVPTALDRLPPANIVKQAREAADRHGGKLLLCFGGNSRTGGFPKMVLSKKRRAKFLAALDKLLQDNTFDGVDYNWEYPNGAEEWQGLAQLIIDSRNTLLAGTAIVTSAFYPDPNQYAIIRHLKLYETCHFLMSMSYDMHGKHSTMEFAVKTIEDWKQHNLPLDRLAVGLPFYGRSVQTGHPETYYDLLPKLQKQYPKQHARDKVDEINGIYFNGRAMLKAKVELAVKEQVGGVMIWELGQDVNPSSNPSSLLSAIGEAVKSAGKQEL